MQNPPLHQPLGRGAQTPRQLAAETAALRSAGVHACGFRQRLAASWWRCQDAPGSVANAPAAGERPGSRCSRAGFNLLELLVVVAIVTLLLLTLAPSLAKTGLSSKSFQCLNNNRQLCNAWRMYADDSHDMIVYSSDDGLNPIRPADQYAWTWSHMDFSPNYQGNWDINYDITHRPLWPYTGRNADIYRCPSDLSYVVVSGVAKPRVRSMSMNFYLGGYAGTTGGFNVGAYRLYLKTTDLTVPGPASTFVFLDERPDWINWGNYFTDMTGYPNTPAAYQFSGDLPGMFHNLGCTFSFADCHAEIHRWLDARTTPPLNYGYVATTIAVPRDPDVAWLQNHATGPK